MKKSIWFAGFLFYVLTLSAMAQETRRVEIFGGYSFLRLTLSDDSTLTLPGATGTFDSVSGNGFMTSMTWNIKRRIGIVGEFSRHTKETNVGNLIRIPVTDGTQNNPRIEARVNTFLFGPRFTLRPEKIDPIQPFAHVLVGGSNGSFEITNMGVRTENSGTGFTFAAGGGIDIKFTSKIAARLVQADYLRTPLGAGSDLNSFRYSAGIVLRLGNLE